MSDAGRPPLPEQTFFDDPALDRLYGVVMALAAELHVARDQIRVLEHLLVSKSVLSPGELNTFRPDAATQQAWDQDRDAFVAALMQNLRGMQVSQGDDPP